MNKKILITALILVVVTFAMPAMISATPSPNGPGQPSVSCQDYFSGLLSPNGFNTEGFAHAGTVYAGSGESLIHSNSGKAVAQYDMACFQQFIHGHLP